MPIFNQDKEIILTGHDSHECMEARIATGHVVIYSAQSPKKHTGNEDSVAIIPINGTQSLFIVADGLGGLANGAEASSITINAITTALRKLSDNEQNITNAILQGLRLATKEIDQHYTDAATTIAIVELNGDEIKTYHAGDSEILVTGQRGKIKLQTISHSPVGYALGSGMIDEESAMYHVKRHLISNAIGLDEMHLEIGQPYTLAQHDTLLLASDGLFDNLFKQEIIKIICHGDLLECGKQLVDVVARRMQIQQTDQPHKPDDMSFILFRPH